MPPSHPQAVTDVPPSLEFRSWGRSPGARPDLMARSCLGGTLLPGCGAGPPAGPMGAAAPRTRCGAPRLRTGCGGQAAGQDPSPPAHPRERDPGPAPRSADAPAQPYMVRAQSSPTQRGPPGQPPTARTLGSPGPVLCGAVLCGAVGSCGELCGAVELSSAGAPQSRGRFPSARLVPLSPRLDSSSSPGAAGNSCADGPPSSPFPSLLFPSRPPRSPPVPNHPWLMVPAGPWLPLPILGLHRDTSTSWGQAGSPPETTGHGDGSPCPPVHGDCLP